YERDTHGNLKYRRAQKSGHVLLHRLILNELQADCNRIMLHFGFPEYFMPKLKTHKGASKRFKKTGTGKVVRQHAFARHILTSKSRKRKNKLHTSVVADESDQAKMLRMLPY